MDSNIDKLIRNSYEQYIERTDWSDEQRDECKQIALYLEELKIRRNSATVHGRWIGKYNTIQYNDWMCSCCGNYETETRNKDRLGDYCRWCGAKMDWE